MRKVDSKEIFSCYLAVEVRLIVTDAEFIDEQIPEQRKNWWIKSVYRDEEVRSLIQSKVYQR